MAEQLIVPTIPLNFLQDLFCECGLEALRENVCVRTVDPQTAADLITALQAVTHLKARSAGQGGRLTAAQNEAATAAMFKGFAAMRALGALD
jgi:hypothetical protein